VSGLVSYTYSRSERIQPRLLGAGPIIPSEFDRPHVFNVVLAVDLGRQWTAGGRFYAYSGKPYTRLFEGQPVPPYNAVRLDPYSRLDLRLEKRWLLGEGKRVSFVAEMLNVFLAREALGVDCSWNLNSNTFPTLRESQDVCQQKKVGPITIPSVGLEATF
jgi:hypothetical protein